MKFHDLKPFKCKQFDVWQNDQVFKVGTDGVLLGAWADIEGVKKILEVGTGTGLISMMLSQRSSIADITAIDIDEVSAEIAKHNIANSPFYDRVNVIHKSLQEFGETTEDKYDLIVSNPPYFINSTKSFKADKNEKRHNNLLSHIDLVNNSANLLNAGGELSVILPIFEGNLFVNICDDFGLNLIKRMTIYSKKSKPAERFLLTFSNVSDRPEIVEEKLYIHNELKERTYTAQYVELTRDFYLYM